MLALQPRQKSEQGMKDKGKGKWGDFSSAIHYPNLSVSTRPVRKRIHVMGLCISTTKKTGFQTYRHF